MAVKFPLKMSDGTLVKTIEELRAHFDLTDVISYYSNGRLINWLESRLYDEEAKKVKALDFKSGSFKEDLCSILGVGYKESEAEKINVDDVLRKNECLKRLRTYTVDDKILASIDHVAFTQKELFDLLDSNIKEIYLCGERFTLPSRKDGITYIGVHSPDSVVEFDSGVISRGIDLQRLQFDLSSHLKNNRISFFDSFSDNTELGLKILRKKAEEGSVMEQTVLGDCYMYGFGVSKKYSIAVEWFSQAARLDYASAQSKLAHCYRYGKGVEENIEKALEWSEKAAEQGDITAQTRMGIFCEKGANGKQDFKEAVKWYRKAAEQGSSTAAYYLGLCYKDGKGLEQNENGAARWLKIAFVNGVDVAKDALMEVKPDLFKLSEVILYAIGEWDNLESFCYSDSETDMESMIEISIRDREKINRMVLEKIGAKNIWISSHYHKRIKEKELQERLVGGVKEGAKYALGGYIGMAYGIYKGIKNFNDNKEEIVEEDTGGGCIYFSMILYEFMKEDINNNILSNLL